MLLHHLLAQVNEEWLLNNDKDNGDFITHIVVCRELGKILKQEGFTFKFNPNLYNGNFEDDDYYEIPVYIDDIDQLFYCNYVE